MINNKTMIKTKAAESNRGEKEAEFHARQSGRRVSSSVTTDNVSKNIHIFTNSISLCV